MRYLLSVMFLLLCTVAFAQAPNPFGDVKEDWDVAIPSVFCDNMVLQRDAPIPVWGKAHYWSEDSYRYKVTVALNGKTVESKMGEDGRWIAYLPAMPAGGPYELSIVAEGCKPLKFSNVMIGDVWLCSGQSNMELPLTGAQNADDEIKDANYPSIRFFTVDKTTDIVPSADARGKWEVCTPETAAKFSGVGFLFGRNLHKKYNVAIGLINSSWGGTPIEPWTGRAGMMNVRHTAEILEIMDVIYRHDPGWSSMPPYGKEAISYVHKESLEEVTSAFTREYLTVPMAAPALNDKKWKTMQLPNAWEGAGLPGFNGVVWFRKTVNIPREWAGKDIVLHLGAIDEVDTTWFNGEKVGAMGDIEKNIVPWDKPRDYTVPGRLVKAGRNVIAVCVFDSLMAGGLWGNDPRAMTVELAGAPGVKPSSLSIGGAWRYKPVATLVPAMPPCSIYNAMIAPLVPYGMRGVLWYQGEGNSSDAKLYQTLLPTLIRDWRKAWGQDFPFLYVQIANLGAPPTDPGARSRFCEIREAQAKAIYLPKVGMAVSMDVSNDDIHPPQKQPVAERLAFAAYALAYGEKVEFTGPIYQSMKVEGNKIRLRFTHTGGGLEAKGGELQTFAICGVDGKYEWAKAQIDGDTVLVWSDKVPAPKAVRYAWADYPKGANLYGKNGLPASPFRTNEGK